MAFSRRYLSPRTESEIVVGGKKKAVNGALTLISESAQDSLISGKTKKKTFMFMPASVASVLDVIITHC